MKRFSKGGAIVAAVCGATLAAPAGASAADAIFGLTDDNRIVRLHSDTPRKVQETVAQVKGGVKDAVDSTADAVREQAQQQGGKVGEVAEKAADKTQEQAGQM